ncbi:hypothetical protein [Actinomycetospora sp.]|uniref:hypothetical protein n=1 Tax=Actinomycetospora sp. TaxID=1872135 RepID=UPI0039C894D2
MTDLLASPGAGGATDGPVADLLVKAGRFFTRREVSPDLRTEHLRGGRDGDVFYRDLGDPVLAWADVVGDPEWRRAYQRARGKGGHVRVSWSEAVEMVAADVAARAAERGDGAAGM